MDTKIKQKQTNIQREILLFLICISSIFMSVGYATINSISFDFEGIVHAEKQAGIFITDYQYQNNIKANTNVSESPISYYSKIGNGYAKITYLRKKET